MVADMIAAQPVVSALAIWFRVGMHGFIRDALTIKLVKTIFSVGGIGGG